MGYPSEAERRRLERFPDRIAVEDLRACFALSDADRRLVFAQRGAENRLGLAVALCAHPATTRSPNPRNVQGRPFLARRVEGLWELTTARLTLAERELRRPLALYPHTTKPRAPGLTTRAALEAALGDENTPLARIRLVMDAWCAIWFWPLEAAGHVAPPTSVAWLDALEGLLGIDPTDRPDSEAAQTEIRE